jgi:hypothetical protein
VGEDDRLEVGEEDWVTDYHASQQHIFAAEQAIEARDPWTAVREFRQAAALQRAFVASLDPEKQPRTVAVFARSAEVLEQRATLLAKSITAYVGFFGNAFMFAWDGEHHVVAADAVNREIERRIVA